jgi:hypothetical protein
MQLRHAYGRRSGTEDAAGANGTRVDDEYLAIAVDVLLVIVPGEDQQRSTIPSVLQRPPKRLGQAILVYEHHLWTGRRRSNQRSSLSLACAYSRSPCGRSLNEKTRRGSPGSLPRHSRGSENPAVLRPAIRCPGR